MKLILLFFGGASLGSFLTLIMFRRRQKLSIIRPRSFCDYCGHSLKVIDLVPVFSYLWNHEKCRFCRHHISSRSFQIELYLGLGLVIFGLNADRLAVFTEIVLSICYLTDLQELKIYTFFPLLLIIGILPFRLANLAVSLLLTVILGLITFLKNGLGSGDLLLLFLFFLFWGFTAGLVCLLISCFLVIVNYLFSLHEPQRQIPFVPYLAWGFLITNLLFGFNLVSASIII